MGYFYRVELQIKSKVLEWGTSHVICFESVPYELWSDDVFCVASHIWEDVHATYFSKMTVCRSHIYATYPRGRKNMVKVIQESVHFIIEAL